MRLQELLPLAFMVFIFISVMAIVSHRARDRRERLRILEEQLRNGRLDAAAQQRAMDELTGRQAGPAVAANSDSPHPLAGRSRWLFSLGWIGIFLGIGLTLTGDRDGEEAGAILIPLGFAFVTLPIAIREVEMGRRRTSP
ncbi:MAG: hypothetical protein AB7I19_10445 [Planctomycetota bacterium]